MLQTVDTHPTLEMWWTVELYLLPTSRAPLCVCADVEDWDKTYACYVGLEPTKPRVLDVRIASEQNRILQEADRGRQNANSM